MKISYKAVFPLSNYRIITLSNYFMIDLIVRNGTTIDVNPLLSA
jgi:hypothetical protein